jgi:hypothetical protein
MEVVMNISDWIVMNFGEKIAGPTERSRKTQR